MDMITSVSDSFHAQGKKVIVVLNVGGIIDTSEWADKVDGILFRITSYNVCYTKLLRFVDSD